MDERIRAELDAFAEPDAAFVERAFRDALRRPPDDEARERALARLADGTLSRATLLHELAVATEQERVRRLDDAVALGLAARARGERLRWLAAPAATDERVVEIPWVLSRLHGGVVLEVGYAFAEPAYVAALLRAAPERLVGVDLAARPVEGMETVEADVRSLPFAERTFDQVLLVSTLEHVGADNTVYGHEAAVQDGGAARLDALRELRRVCRPSGRIVVTVPLGEPGEHGWFRQDDVHGWNRLFARAGLFVEEQEAYELGEEGWRAAPAFRAEGVRYGERGPAASAVLCAELSVSRTRRLASPGGLARTARRRLAPVAHRARG
ncbi:MAG: methyltransferase domain-containing protein [Gaiella sp.]